MNSDEPVETCSTVNLSATSMSSYIVGSIPTYVSCFDNLNQFENTKKKGALGNKLSIMPYVVNINYAIEKKRDAMTSPSFNQ